jgi:putative FmdB family regulatory protein
MPIYEFHCKGCEEDFEKLVPAGSTAPECPKCGGREVNRLLSVFASRSSGGGMMRSGPSGSRGGCCGGGCGCH